MSGYVYSIAEDTANGSVNLDSLSLEIKGSGIGAVLEGIRAQSDVLTVIFDQDLLAAEEATLDSVVSNHQGVAPTLPVKIELQHNGVRYHVSGVKVIDSDVPEPAEVIIVG